MCLESTGLHEITFNLIKKYIAIPLEGSHRLPLAILSLEHLLNKL